jgi:hypothetical protein
MKLEDPNGREITVYFDPLNLVQYNTRVKSGVAWYVNREQQIRWWQDLERLKVVKP